MEKPMTPHRVLTQHEQWNICSELKAGIVYSAFSSSPGSQEEVYRMTYCLALLNRRSQGIKLGLPARKGNSPPSRHQPSPGDCFKVHSKISFYSILEC